MSIALTLLLFLVVAFAFSRARFDRTTIAIVLAGLALYLGYLSYTDFGERNYDAGAQLEYIEFLATHHARPPATACIACLHPPLYYALGAMVLRACEATHVTTTIRGLQFLGLALHLTFLGFALATARLLLRAKRAQHLAALSIVFWPYGVEHSVRVHNDSLATMLMASSTYFLVRYWGRDEARALYASAFAAALGLMTKSSAYASVLALGVIVALRLWRAVDRKQVAARVLVASSILATGPLLNALTKTPVASSSPSLCHALLGNACDIGQHQWVPNTFASYVNFDLPGFLRDPYVLAEKDEGGRAYFWNHLLKSSLFGTHNAFADPETAYAFNRGIALGMNWLLLAMLAFLFVGALLFARRRAVSRFAPLLASLASCLALMMAFRALIPAPHHSDFRHVYALVSVLAILYVATLARFARVSRWLARFGAGLAVAFSLGSIVYFAPKQTWLMRVTKHTVVVDPSPYEKGPREALPWNADGNLLIEPNEVIEMPWPTRTVRAIDVSFDNNDRYAIELIGLETRRFEVGPKLGVLGLARYVLTVDPPMESVRAVRVTPLEGDYAYSMGHMILR